MENRRPKVLIFAGHSSRARGMKSEYLQISEWSFTRMLLDVIITSCDAEKLQLSIVTDKTLPKKAALCNQDDYDLVIDLHLNSFKTKQVGHLCLYWYKSWKGKVYARFITNSLGYNAQRHDLAIRGKVEKGSFFLRKTKASAVIIELCFIDNYDDIVSFMRSLDTVASQLIKGIMEGYYFLTQPNLNIS